jgi:predicted MFS family arabinose efflux permease
MATSPAADDPGAGDGRWTIVLGCALGSTVGLFTTVLLPFSIVMGPVRAELGWTSTDVSLALTCCYIGFSSTAYRGGAMFDRVSPRKLMMGSYALLGALLAGLGALPASRFALYAVYAAIGVVGVGTSVVAHSRIITGWFSRRRGAALGCLNAGVALGAFSTPQLVHRCLPALGWRGTFAVLGGLSAVVGVAATAALIVDPPRRAAAVQIAPATDARWAWGLLALFSAFGLATSACISHLSPMLAGHGLTAEQATFGVALFGLAGIFGRLAVGRLLDSVAPRRILAACALTAAAFALILAGRIRGTAALIAPVLLGLAYGAELDLLPFLVARRHGVAGYASVFGRLFAAFAVASAVGPPVMAAVFDASGAYRAALVGCAAVFVAVALAAVRFVDRVQGRSARR